MRKNRIILVFLLAAFLSFQNSCSQKSEYYDFTPPSYEEGSVEDPPVTYEIKGETWEMTLPAKGWNVRDVNDHPELVKIGEHESLGGFFISEKKVTGVTLEKVKALCQKMFNERLFTIINIPNEGRALKSEGFQLSDDGTKKLKSFDITLVKNDVIYSLQGMAETNELLIELEKIFMSFTFMK